MKKITYLLLKSQKSMAKKFKTTETWKLYAILGNFHKSRTYFKMFSPKQPNFMKNWYQLQNLKIQWIYENRILTFNFCRNSMKSHTSEYYIGYWVVSSDLCFCKDLKNTSRLQKIWILDPVNIKSKSPLCACRPCTLNYIPILLRFMATRAWSSLPKLKTSTKF